MHKSFIALFIGVTLSNTALADESSTVNLQFNWPDELNATFHYEIEKTDQAGEQESFMSMSGTADFTASKKDGMHAVTTGNYDLQEIKDDGSMPEFNRFITEQLSGVQATMMVSADGMLESVTGYEAFVSEIRNNIYSRGKDQPEAVQAAVKQMVESVLSDDELLALAAKDWELIVSQWNGAQLESGYVYETQYGTPVELLNNEIAPTTGFFEYLGPIKCTEASQTIDCAHLKFTSELDAEYRSQIEALVQEQWDTPEVQNTTFNVQTEQLVVTDPNTLVPYQVTDITRVYGFNPADGTQTVSVERKSGVYTYANP